MEYTTNEKTAIEVCLSKPDGSFLNIILKMLVKKVEELGERVKELEDDGEGYPTEDDKEAEQITPMRVTPDTHLVNTLCHFSLTPPYTSVPQNAVTVQMPMAYTEAEKAIMVEFYNWGIKVGKTYGKDAELFTQA